MQKLKDQIHEIVSISKHLENTDIGKHRKDILKRIREEAELALSSKTIDKVHYHLKFINGRKRKGWGGEKSDGYDYGHLKSVIYSYKSRSRDNGEWNDDYYSFDKSEDIGVESVKQRLGTYYEIKDVKRDNDINIIDLEMFYDTIERAKKMCSKLAKGKLKTKASVFREILKKKHPRTFTGKDAKDAYIEAAKKLGIPIRCNNIHEQIGYALKDLVLFKRERVIEDKPGMKWCTLYGYTNNSLELKWIPQKQIKAAKKEIKEDRRKQKEKERKQKEEDFKGLLNLFKPL